MSYDRKDNWNSDKYIRLAWRVLGQKGQLEWPQIHRTCLAYLETEKTIEIAISTQDLRGMSWDRKDNWNSHKYIGLV